MRIVHYTLGIYPHRTGGLNRYATDLIKEQSKEHIVTILLPGEWKPWINKCYINRANQRDSVSCYKLKNALPLSLLYGIRTPKDFLDKPISTKSFEAFYDTVKPDVLHLHTLMGLPEAALLFFKKKGVRIVFTSHDYFGICPKVNMINEAGQMCLGPNQERCLVCNKTAPTSLFLRIRNSKFTFIYRDFIRCIKTIKHS